MEIIEMIGKLIESDPLSGIVLAVLAIQWFNARNQERDDRNTTSALSLASSVVTTFEPIKLLLTKLVDRVDDSYKTTQAIVQNKFEEAATEMKEVKIQRDGQHTEIIQRLEKQAQQIALVAQQITDDTDEKTLRYEMRKLMASMTELLDKVRIELAGTEKDEPEEA